MSSETLAHEVTDAAPEEHAPGHAHPGDKQYIVVALILGVFTAIEVLTYFLDFAGAAIPTLIVLMVIKFAMVAAYFMHLKFDSRLFTRLFVTGLVLALGVYFVMLSVFGYWS